MLNDLLNLNMIYDGTEVQVIWNKRVGEELMKAGHDVTIYMMMMFEIRNPKVDIDPRIRGDYNSFATPHIFHFVLALCLTSNLIMPLVVYRPLEITPVLGIIV